MEDEAITNFPSELIIDFIPLRRDVGNGSVCQNKHTLPVTPRRATLFDDDWRNLVADTCPCAVYCGF